MRPRRCASSSTWSEARTWCSAPTIRFRRPTWSRSHCCAPPGCRRRSIAPSRTTIPAALSRGCPDACASRGPGMKPVAGALVGQSVARAEDPRFVAGAGTFVDDVERDGMLHAVVLRSSFAHARIARFEASAAAKMDGVHAVISAADIGELPVIPLRLANLPEFKPYLQPVIARDVVRYVGEPVAVLVARTRAIAEDAIEAIAIDYGRLPAVTDCQAADAVAPLFAGTQSNHA